MADLPGRPPIDQPFVDPASGRLTPVWAQWIMQLWLYIKGL